MKKILIANIFGIGDVLFTTPLIASIKRQIKDAEIDYLCNARTIDIVENNPHINNIFVYEKDDFTELWKRSKADWMKASLGLFKKIRNRKYDSVYDFTLSRKFGILFKLAGIPRRIGFDYKNRGIFLTEKVPLTGFEGRHVIEYYLELLEKTGIDASINEMQLIPDKDAMEWVSAYLKDKDYKIGRLIAIVPGGGASWGAKATRKRWNSAKFAEAGDILGENDMNIVILGDNSEKDLCRIIGAKMKKSPVIIENGLNLQQYMALLSKCDLVLCNDGGPLHIAVALGKKTVSIFGPVDEKVYGPYPFSEKHKVIKAEEISCMPCYNRFKLPECDYDIKCLTEIEPRDVAGACIDLLLSKENV